MITTIEIENFKKRVSNLIDQRRLRRAIKELQEMAQKHMIWEVSDRLQQVERSYGYMLSYVAQGIIDPERKDVHENIVTDIYASLDLLVHKLELGISPKQYYGVLRLFQRSPSPDRLERLFRAYSDELSNNALFLLNTDNENAEEKKSRRRLENLQIDIFQAIWVQPHLSNSDQQALQNALQNQEYSPSFKVFLLSAVILGLLQCFDSARLYLLMNVYVAASDIKMKAAALVGLLFAFRKYQGRPLPKKLKDQLALVRDQEHWHSDLRTAFIEIIRSSDTERINKKIQNEIVPDMLNLRPEIMEKIRDGEINPRDMASLEANPEWQELLDKNGITDKLKELTEMQMEGGDVMMGTFAHLKNFPFFNEISNWFLPFSSRHTQVEEQSKKFGSLGEIFDSAQFLCDGDKYSFMFALGMVPEDQRQMMTNQFQSQNEGLFQALSEKEKASHTDAMRRAINSYLQNFYRFFKLYRRKEEFWDPFIYGVNLVNVPVLAEDFDDLDLLEVVAEFYFKLGYMSDALDVFERLDSIMPGDAPRYQKMGYAYESQKNFPQAIKKYSVAELLDQDGVWTIRRLAACYRAMGDKQKALEYYRMLVSKRPDDLSAVILLGYVLLENNQLDDAVQQFFKAEFLEDKSNKALRPLAWTLFLLGRYDEALKYYQRVIEDKPTPTDYLNMGHVSLASGDMRSAVNFYKLSLEASDRKGFINSWDKDKSIMLEAGIDSSLLALIMDAVVDD